MSLWADYLQEKYNKTTIEREDSFATYMILDSNNELYVEDIYCTPETRKTGGFIPILKDLVEVAKINNCDKVSCYVFLVSNRPEEAIQWLIKIGFKVANCVDNKLFFVLYIKDFKYA